MNFDLSALSFGMTAIAAFILGMATYAAIEGKLKFKSLMSLIGVVAVIYVVIFAVTDPESFFSFIKGWGGKAKDGIEG